MNNEKKILINKKIWSQFSEEEMEQYVEDCVRYFRLNNYLYFPTFETWRRNELRKLLNYDYSQCIDEDNKLIKQTMHGLALAWSYHPHYAKVRCNNKLTPYEAYHDDNTLRNIIRKRIRLGDNMSGAALRKTTKIYTGVQCVSNFRPTAAAAIYRRFTPTNGVVYDMSAGFGGRMLGAMISQRKYYAVEPASKTYNGLVKMANDYQRAGKADIHKGGSEFGHPQLKPNSVDLCFTSPPYFDCEKYSDEETQSYIKYPTKEKWINEFMHDTLEHCISYLKDDGKLILNVANVPSHKTLVNDIVRLCEFTLGLSLVEEWGLVLSKMGNGFKTEPILVFEKS